MTLVCVCVCVCVRVCACIACTVPSFSMPAPVFTASAFGFLPPLINTGREQGQAETDRRPGQPHQAIPAVLCRWQWRQGTHTLCSARICHHEQQWLLEAHSLWQVCACALMSSSDSLEPTCPGRCAHSRRCAHVLHLSCSLGLLGCWALFPALQELAASRLTVRLVR